MANSSETIGQTKTPAKRPHTKILVGVVDQRIARRNPVD